MPFDTEKHDVIVGVVTKAAFLRELEELAKNSNDLTLVFNPVHGDRELKRRVLKVAPNTIEMFDVEKNRSSWLELRPYSKYYLLTAAGSADEEATHMWGFAIQSPGYNQGLELVYRIDS